MSANVETMMYVRETPWHGLGTKVLEAPTSADALRLAGLDWNVNPMPIYTADGFEIPNYKVNMRDKDNKPLGIVTDKYSIVQNADAFAFTDNLVDDATGVKYETAGSLQGGKKIWLLAKMPSTKIVGDEVEPYVCFTNSHDGTGAVRVCMTPIRVVCNNTLNMALKQAKRSWSCKHMGNIAGKLDEAKNTLFMANEYMEELAKVGDRLANTSVTREAVEDMVKAMFPIEDADSDRKKANMKKLRDDFMVCMFMPDILKFDKTAWQVVNAASDFVGHTTPNRNTKSYAENNWGKIMNGHPIFDAICDNFAKVA